MYSTQRSSRCVFSAAPGVKAIAVLHPRKLGVYTVEAVGGSGAQASYYNLVKAYEHALGAEGGGHFTSCNMTHGGFGGVSRDLLCVQSMDGRVQARFIISCFHASQYVQENYLEYYRYQLLTVGGERVAGRYVSYGLRLKSQILHAVQHSMHE